MKAGTVGLTIFLCLFLEEALSVQVYIFDLPDYDNTKTISDSDYAYYDYDQIIPNLEAKSKQKLNEKENAVKEICKRFGSMYGIDTSKHQCEELLRIEDRIRRKNSIDIDSKSTKKPSQKEQNPVQIRNTEFAQDYVDYFWRSGLRSCTESDIVNNKCKHNSDVLDRLLESKSALKQEFSQDYADDIWRSKSEKEEPQNCTLSDIINKKCKSNSNAINQLSGSKSDKDSDTKSKPEKGFGSTNNLWKSANVKNLKRTCTLSDFINNRCKFNSDARNMLQINLFPNPKSTLEKEFSQDYVKNGPQNYTIKDIIHHKRNPNSNDVNKLKSMSTKRFPRDNVDDFWRSQYGKNIVVICTINDIVNNKCNVNSKHLNQIKSNLLSNSKSDLKLNEDRDEKLTTGNEFSRDYADDFWRSTNEKNSAVTCTISDIINNKCDTKSDEYQTYNHDSIENDGVDSLIMLFAQDYADDWWKSRNPNNDATNCSLSDIINSKCEFNSDVPKRLKLNKNNNSKSNKAKKEKMMQGIKPLKLVLSDFALDYVDGLWGESRVKKTPPDCTVSDYIYNKCEIKTDAQNRFSYLKSDRDKGERCKNLKENNFGHATQMNNHLGRFSTDYVDHAYQHASLENSAPTPSHETEIKQQLLLNKEFNSLLLKSANPLSISRRNNLIQFRPNQFRNKFRSGRSSDTDASDQTSAETSASEEKMKKAKPKRFQIVRNKNKKIPNPKKSKKESYDTDTDESNEIIKLNDDDSGSIESVIGSVMSAESVESGEKQIKPELSDIENELTDLDTSDSFESGPKKASDKYEYLQGHRVIKPKAVKTSRRSSRLQTFLPKRYNWKREDIPNLGYYWFDGPKGPYPSEYM